MMHSVFNDIKEYEEVKVGMPIGTRRTPCTCPYCENGGVRNEEGIKLHQCAHPDCGKIYRKTSHLKVHIRSHSGEKPFKCKWNDCVREFARSDELIRHTRTHTADKKFLCTECDKRFMRSDHLRKHITTHSRGNQQLICQICDRRFLRKENLEIHIKTHETDSYNIQRPPHITPNTFKRGQPSGLKRYLNEIEITLVPVKSKTKDDSADDSEFSNDIEEVQSCDGSVDEDINIGEDGFFEEPSD